MPALRIVMAAMLAALGAGCAADAARPEAEFAHAEAGIRQLQEAMASGRTSSQELVRAYQARIEALDRNGPRLNAYIALNPDALAEAAALDAERRAGRVRGPLHGIPVVLKDNIDATPMATTAGSLALRDLRPRRDAFLVQRLRQAGAVILGKANLSEWANFRSTRSISGWSSAGGQARNPYAPDRSPCGSSSGTAVAVAGNLAVVGIGTETDGSILCPAAVTGIVGLKPTVGLVSRDGIVPIAHSQDTAGPMARTVEDAALVLAAIAGADPADPASAAIAGSGSDYAAQLDGTGVVRGLRIGLLRKHVEEVSPAAAAATTAAMEVLRAAGATVVEVDLPTEGQWKKDEFQVLLHEFHAGLERYLREHDAPLQTLEALMAFNREHADAVMPLFGQELFEQAAATGGLDDPDYLAARERARRLAGPEGIDATLRAHQLDVLVAPVTDVAWKIEAGGDPDVAASYSAAAVAGYPSLTVPMGEAGGLPLGLGFYGPAWSEARLLRIGHAFESLLRARRAPKLQDAAAAR